MSMADVESLASQFMGFSLDELEEETRFDVAAQRTNEFLNERNIPVNLATVNGYVVLPKDMVANV